MSHETETFWSNSAFQCPFLSCDHFSTLIQSSLNHMSSAHNITVQNVHQVRPFLAEYLSTLNSNFTQNTTVDEQKRIGLSQKKLNQILDQQRREQSEPFAQKCLFCKLSYTDRMEYFSHMFSEHGFALGQLDNIVFVNEYINSLRAKLDRVTCLYCDGVFTDHVTLRKHQRKKKHFRVHSKNSHYDRYYIRNYSWEAQDDLENIESDGDFEDWEEYVDVKTQCLFDEEMFDDLEACLDHMHSKHGVDLLKIEDVYLRIKYVNYVRKQVQEVRCFKCNLEQPNLELLYSHLTHCSEVFDLENRLEDTNLMFPTIEDDPLLMVDNFDETTL